MFSTSEGYHDSCERDIMSTSRGGQYIGSIMIHVGQLIDKRL